MPPANEPTNPNNPQQPDLQPVVPTFGSPLPGSVAQPQTAPAAQTASPANTPESPVQPTEASNPATDVDPTDDDLETEEPETDDTLLNWQNTEPDQVHRSTTWYIIIALIFAASIIAAILTRTWIYIPLGILVPAALAMYGQRKPGQHSYILSTHTISVDNKRHHYDEFKAFFEIADGNQSVFELIPIKRFGTLVTLHTSPDVAETVGEILASVLPETEPEGYLGESVFKRLKF